jgi:two-component system cell cycle response regulator DivK
LACILIVEDTADIRKVVELILDDAGHAVVSACTGEQGVVAAAHAQPDVILMDLALPSMDGWEATRRLKADPVTREIPVIAFTANVMPDATEHALDAGCSAVITKPFEIDALLNQIDTCLSENSW